MVCRKCEAMNACLLDGTFLRTTNQGSYREGDKFILYLAWFVKGVRNFYGCLQPVVAMLKR
jgi:hypothetical protein